MASSPFEPYPARLRRLLRRWNPSGMLVSDAKAHAATKLLSDPRAASFAEASEVEAARCTFEAAVHPVLQQPVPSAFRICSFVPVTTIAAIGISSSGSAAGTLFWHWFYQSHSAAVRYCNYADTSRDLDPRQMTAAYAVSTASACAIGLGALHSRLPRRLTLAAPHLALCFAGGLSTWINSWPMLERGVPLLDESGVAIPGVSSTAAARATVERAALLQAVLVPACALLVPTAVIRAVLAPHLWRTAPQLLPLAASATVLGSVGGLTPLATAAVPAYVSLAVADLEPEARERVAAEATAAAVRGTPARVYSDRPLY
mmetsp:Transcript_29009/g.95309  ORF Transcript_29009/g.95309 Transcript_29009/m.95309 type:complete len:316 (-) Transcript_29009:91-1038(-)